MFFFKQKTAYEVRISDWSSDVCSSDLALQAPTARRARSGLAAGEVEDPAGVALRDLAGLVVGHVLQHDRQVLPRVREVAVAVGVVALEHEVVDAGQGPHLDARLVGDEAAEDRSEEHTSELQSLMRIS